MKALVKAWEQQEDSSQEPSINAVIAVMQVQNEQLMREAEKEKASEKVDLHSAMLAAAKDRYAEEVAEQAKELGMVEEWEEEVVSLLLLEDFLEEALRLLLMEEQDQ